MLGTRIGKADGLSRRLDWKIGVDKNNENQVVVKDSWVCRLEEVIIEGPEVEVVEKIKRCYKLHSACISTTSRLIFTN